MATAVFVVQSIQAARELLTARDQVETVRAQITDGDFDAAARTLQELTQHTERARKATDGLLWDVGRYIPFLGKNIGAVQDISEALDTATRENAPTALRLSREVSDGTFRPKDGRFDIAAIERLTPDVVAAAESMESVAELMGQVDSEDLLFPINDLAADFETEIDGAASAATATARSFRLLPEALGATSPKTWLLVVQNPAEIRATGGLPGSFALLHARRGKVELGWQGSVQKMAVPGRADQMNPEALRHYGDLPAVDIRDANLSPDFPEFAELVRGYAKRSQGFDVDGVLSVDPVGMAGLLAGTGPVQVQGLELTSENLVPVLLNTIYQMFDNQDDQHAFFEDTARAVFDAVVGGQGSQQRAIQGLARAVNEHRVQVWSADPQVQQELAPTAVGGSIADTRESPEDGNPRLGVYLNDTVAGKMDYYLAHRVAVSPQDCRADGGADYRAVVELTSHMPQDFAKLSDWIVGFGEPLPKGVIGVNLRFYSPAGAVIKSLSVDDEPRTISADPHRGRVVATMPIRLDPGQTVRVEAELQTAPEDSNDLRVDFTPGMVRVDNGFRVSSPC